MAEQHVLYMSADGQPFGDDAEYCSSNRTDGRLCEQKRLLQALGNLKVIFRVLHKVSRWHPEWYGGMTLDCGCGLGMMLELTKGLYCKMRAKEDLKASLVEEMDACAVVMNARYDRMFGGWDETSFTDMVKGKGQQERDYSQVETWPLFATLIKESGMKKGTLRNSPAGDIQQTGGGLEWLSERGA